MVKKFQPNKHVVVVSVNAGLWAVGNLLRTPFAYVLINPALSFILYYLSPLLKQLWADVSLVTILSCVCCWTDRAPITNYHKQKGMHAIERKILGFVKWAAEENQFQCD